MAIINWIDGLEESKTKKILELDIDCNTAILGRFSSSINGVTYYFSNDTEAQANFEKADNAFFRGRMTEITWTAYDEEGNVVRLPLDQTTFESVYMNHLIHIQSNISKYRDMLMPQVEQATTIEEVENIMWDTPLTTQSQVVSIKLAK